MTHTHNNPVYIRDVRISKLRELKTRMEKLNYSSKEIAEKLTNHCLYQWHLTIRTANDYVKVANMSFDDDLPSMLAYKEKLLEVNQIQS